jgi:hypothetical protein
MEKRAERCKRGRLFGLPAQISHICIKIGLSFTVDLPFKRSFASFFNATKLPSMSVTSGVN